jgi:hypothetical protein
MADKILLEQQNFLLTYRYYKDSSCRFEWFENEEDLRNFIKTHNIVILEAIEILDCKEIKI